MVVNGMTTESSPAHSIQDQLFANQQQFHTFQQQQQQQQILFPQLQQQHNYLHQSLASHFHLLHLVENLVDVIENATQDQHADALVNELNNQFEKCQQLLNSISSSINVKSMTVEEQKRDLEEAEQLSSLRRDFIDKYKETVRALTNHVE